VSVEGTSVLVTGSIGGIGETLPIDRAWAIS
jgi:hypothetical protein